ncbi:MAG: hypothetical protein H0W25_08890 [Acidimicrobiia bacterium]|nr:hypothetical protein [Acidimicrobiia bacterium]
MSSPRVPVELFNEASAFDKVIADHDAGRLDAAATVLEGTRALAAHPDLSVRYRGGTRGPTESGTTLAMKLFQQFLPFADAATMDLIECVLHQPFTTCLSEPPPSTTTTTTAPPTTAPPTTLLPLVPTLPTSPTGPTVPALLPQSAVAAPQALAASLSGDGVSTHETEHFVIEFDFGDVGPGGPIDDDDGDGDGIPDEVESVGQNAEAAYAVYEDFFGRAPQGTLRIVLKRGLEITTIEDSLFACGTAWPGFVQDVHLGIQPNQVNIDPNCGGFEDYLPRHEVAHLFQYQFVSSYDVTSEVLPLDLGRDSTLWWLEASAEWMTHRVSEAQPSLGALHEYDSNLHTFLAHPEGDLTRFDDENRQYGAFIFAEFLEQEFGADAIQDVFERIGERTDVQVPLPIPLCEWSLDFPPVQNCRAARQAVHDPLHEDTAVQAIGDEIAERGSSWSAVLPDFAEANYRLCLDSGGCEGGYDDPDVDDWTRELDDSNEEAVEDDDLAGFRPGRGRYEVPTLTPAAGNVFLTLPPIATGGTAYTDFTWQTEIERAVIRFEVQLAEDADPAETWARVLVWDNHPSTCQAPSNIPLDSNGHGSVDVLMVSTCRFATVVVTDLDPEDQLRVPELPIQDWYETDTPRHNVRGTFLHGGAVVSDLAGDIALGVLPLGTLGTNTTTVRHQPTNTEGVGTLFPWEGWGMADRHTGDGSSALFRYALGSVQVESFDVDNEDGETATAVTTVARSRLTGAVGFEEAEPLARITHRVRPTASPAVFAVRVEIENLDDDEILPVYRRVVDWNVPPTAFDEAITSSYGTVDPATGGIQLNGTGVFHPHPLLRPPEGAAGPTVNLVPANGGAIIDIGPPGDAGLAPGATFSFTLYYGAATTEAAALAAVQSVGGNAHVLAKPSNQAGLDTGAPLTFVLAVGP